MPKHVFDQVEAERLGYRPAEFAQLFGITRVHTHNMIARGEIRAIKLGRATVIPASEVNRLLEGGIDG